MSDRTSATPCSRNHSKDSRWTAIRSGSWRTSCSFENERRSRDAREANVTPSRGGGGSVDRAGGRADGAQRPSRLTQRRQGRADTTSEQPSPSRIPVQDTMEQTPRGLVAGGRLRHEPRQVKVPTA